MHQQPAGPLSQPRDILLAHPEQIPAWLAAEEPMTFTVGNLQSFLKSRIVYYPGSLTDGHVIKLFGGSQSAHCFVHCDLDIDIDQVRQELQTEHGGHPRGYSPQLLQVLPAQQLTQAIQVDALAPFSGFNLWPGAHLEGALWAIFTRQLNFDTNHGPERLALLHIRAEAIWAYHQLWAQRHLAPYAILLQDHGWGGNWTHLGGDHPLFQTANGVALPNWLFVASNTDSWPGYQPIGGFDPGGMHGHPRRLYQHG
jgi:hypothetical protein